MNNLTIITSFIPSDNFDEDEDEDVMTDQEIETKFNLKLKRLDSFYADEFYYEISGSELNIKLFSEEFLNTDFNDVIINMTETIKFYQLREKNLFNKK